MNHNDAMRLSHPAFDFGHAGITFPVSPDESVWFSVDTFIIDSEWVELSTGRNADDTAPEGCFVNRTANCGGRNSSFAGATRADINARMTADEFGVCFPVAIATECDADRVEVVS